MDYIDKERFEHENSQKDCDKIYAVISTVENEETEFVNSAKERETGEEIFQTEIDFLKEFYYGSNTKFTVELGWHWENVDYKDMRIIETFKN